MTDPFSYCEKGSPIFSKRPLRGLCCRSRHDLFSKRLMGGLVRSIAFSLPAPARLVSMLLKCCFHVAEVHNLACISVALLFARVQTCSHVSEVHSLTCISVVAERIVHRLCGPFHARRRSILFAVCAPVDARSGVFFLPPAAVRCRLRAYTQCACVGEQALPGAPAFPDAPFR